jgi:hypothetical protein
MPEALATASARALSGRLVLDHNCFTGRQSSVQRPRFVDKSTKVGVNAVGKRIEVRLNNEAKPIVSITDNLWSSGQVGVRLYTDDKHRAVCAFDNVRVTSMGL